MKNEAGIFVEILIHT